MDRNPAQTVEPPGLTMEPFTLVYRMPSCKFRTLARRSACRVRSWETGL